MTRSSKTKASQAAKQPPLDKRRWGSKEARYRSRLLHHWQKWRVEKPGYWWRERVWWQRIVIVLIILGLLSLGGMYGIAQWYIQRHANEPLRIGATFVPDQARSFGLDPQQTMEAAITDLGLRRLRLVSYWNNIEPTQGHYNFEELDWQFRLAEETHTKISLSIGLRQPRWPECHMPDWASSQPKAVWYPKLQKFMSAVVKRYQHSPSLESYQLENEYFLQDFGVCPDFSRDRLVEEFKLVKNLDSRHLIIISRSNNAVPSWPLGQPRPDSSAAAIYKRVRGNMLGERYIEYPFPSWYYAFMAGGEELTTGRNTILHELQFEPWLPGGQAIQDATTQEQDQSMSAKDVPARLQFGLNTGMRTIDLWGLEWWYWRKTVHHDPSVWNAVKTEIQNRQDQSIY